MGDWSSLFLGQCAQECNRFNRYQILIVAIALFSFIFCRFFLPHIAEGLLKDLLRLAMVQESRLETTSRAVNSPGLQQCSVCPVLFLLSTTSEKRIEILYEEGDQAHNVRIRNPKLSVSPTPNWKNMHQSYARYTRAQTKTLNIQFVLQYVEDLHNFTIFRKSIKIHKNLMFLMPLWFMFQTMLDQAQPHLILMQVQESSLHSSCSGWNQTMTHATAQGWCEGWPGQRPRLWDGQAFMVLQPTCLSSTVP